MAMNLKDWYNGMADALDSMDLSGNLSDFVSSKLGDLPQGAQMAAAMDGLGLDMTRLESDGSYKVAGEDIAYGEGSALGIFDENGNLDAKAAMSLLDTKYEDMGTEQKDVLDNISYVNRNVMAFAKDADGNSLADTKDGEALGDFLGRIDEVSDLQEFQGQNPIAQMGTVSDIVNDGMNAQDALAGATVEISPDDMRAYNEYMGVMDMCRNGELTSEGLREKAAEFDVPFASGEYHSGIQAEEPGTAEELVGDVDVSGDLGAEAVADGMNEGIMEGEVKDGTEAESVDGVGVDAPGNVGYVNQGDTNVTININVTPQPGMSMKDMVMQQMDGLGIEMPERSAPAQQVPDELRQWADGVRKDFGLVVPDANKDKGLVAGPVREGDGTAARDRGVVSMSREDRLKMMEDVLRVGGVDSGLSQSTGIEME